MHWYSIRFLLTGLDRATPLDGFKQRYVSLFYPSRLSAPLRRKLFYRIQIHNPIARGRHQPCDFGLISARWRAVPRRILKTCGSVGAAE